MSYGLYISAEGAMAQGRRLETIANNLANVDTVGFKRDLALFQARYAEAIQQGLELPGSGSIDDVGGGVMVQETKTDFSPGTLKRTGLPTDVAILGDGFFLVQRDGQQMLTRAGNFQITPAGQLISQDGDPVLSASGAPLGIDPLAGPWTITADGGLQQAGNVELLALVEPESLGDLCKVGENLFRPLADVRPLLPDNRRVAQGTLEMSVVRPTTEMMEMIEASRAFEANVTLIRNHDQMLGSLVNRLLRTG